VVRLPVGQAFITQQGGLFCVTTRTVTWPGGQSDFNNPSFKDAFRTQFIAAGLKTEGDPDNLFEASTSTADYAVAGIVTDMTERYCTPRVNDAAQKGEVSFSVDWQLYSRLQKQIIATSHTTGSARLDDAKPGGLQILTADAFTENVKQLAQAPAIRKALAGAARAESELVKPDVQDKIPLLAANGPPRSVEAAVASVVLIRAGDAQGTGVLVSRDGYIITAAHVVSSATSVKVRWSDGTEATAEVVRDIKGRDVCLLKVDSKGHAPLPLRRDEPPVGEPVFAVGSLLGEKFQSSVTKGVMSADRVNDGYAYIQSDVTTGPGGSGGPLLDAQGRVVGLTVSGIRPLGLIPTGINMFVPARDVIDFLGLDLK
jgi:S1-C subfamily serine protease